MAKILVVDDDPLSLDLIHWTFKEAGHEAFPFQDSREVMPFARKTFVDAIILDIVMPDLSGWDLLDMLRKNPKTKALPILMLSGLTDAPSRIRGIRAGANDYLVKPFEPEELLARAEGLIIRHNRDISGLQGNLETYSTSEALHNLEHNRKTGYLEITQGDLHAEIWIKDGNILRAKIGALEQVEAVSAMLEMRQGVFRFHPREELSLNHEDEPLQLHPIILDNAWVEDELRLRLHRLPAPNQKLQTDGDLPFIPITFRHLPIRPVAHHLDRFPGTNLGTLLKVIISAPNRIKLALAWLIEQDAVLIEV